MLCHAVLCHAVPCCAADQMKSLRGSVFWMAPEVLTGIGYGKLHRPAHSIHHTPSLWITHTGCLPTNQLAQDLLDLLVYPATQWAVTDSPCRHSGMCQAVLKLEVLC